MDQLRQEYMEIKAIIDASEASLTRKIKDEEMRVSSKYDTIYQVLLKKKSEMQSLKEEIELSLTKGDEYEFLGVGCPDGVGESFLSSIPMVFFCLFLMGAGFERGASCLPSRLSTA
jgi:hypothetical protein